MRCFYPGACPKCARSPNSERASKTVCWRGGGGGGGKVKGKITLGRGGENFLRNSEPEILRLAANSNPEVTMLAIRKYNHTGPFFEASTRLDLANSNQIEVLLNYARAKPFFAAMLETLPRYTPRSSIFNNAAIAITQVQQAAGKSFVLT